MVFSFVKLKVVVGQNVGNVGLGPSFVAFVVEKPCDFEDSGLPKTLATWKNTPPRTHIFWKLTRSGILKWLT